MSEIKKPVTRQEIEDAVARQWEVLGLPNNSGGDRCQSVFVDLIISFLTEREGFAAEEPDTTDV